MPEFVSYVIATCCHVLGRSRPGAETSWWSITLVSLKFPYNSPLGSIAKVTAMSAPLPLPKMRSQSLSNCSRVTVEGLIQPSSVMPGPVPTFRLADCTRTYDELPFTEKAVLTSPGSYPKPFIAIPLFPPTLSSVLFSAFHQATTPEGAGVQVGTGGLVTVSIAPALVEPYGLLTVT